MRKQLCALLLALILLACLAPARAAGGDIRLVFAGLESGGLLIPMERLSPAMRGEFILRTDGTALYRGAAREVSGAWTALEDGYEFASDELAAVLLSDGEGGYVWSQGGMRRVFSRAEYGEAFPEHIAAFTVPFAGDIEQHRQALEKICVLLDHDARYAGDGADGALSWVRYEVNGYALYLICPAGTRDVCAYAFRDEASSLPDTEEAGRATDDRRHPRPELSVMLVECGVDEKAFLAKLAEIDVTAEVEAIVRAMWTQGADRRVPCFGHYLTMFYEDGEDGPSYCWYVYHNTPPEGEAGPTAPPTAGNWKCPSCGAINSGKACIACGAARPEQEAEPTPAPEPTPEPVAGNNWKCASCGAVNSGKACIACGAARPGQGAEPTPAPEPTPEPMAGNNWKCASCGAVNSGKACIACGAARPEQEAEPTPAPEPTLEPMAGNNWKCASCGAVNSGKACIACGAARPEPGAEPTPTPEPTPEPATGPKTSGTARARRVGDTSGAQGSWKCLSCGAVNTGKSCIACGAKPGDD